MVLIRSVIRSRRKNIGKENEYVNDDPKYAEFFLTENEDELVNQETPSDLVRGEASQQSA